MSDKSKNETMIGRSPWSDPGKGAGLIIKFEQGHGLSDSCGHGKHADCDPICKHCLRKCKCICHTNPVAYGLPVPEKRTKK